MNLQIHLRPLLLAAPLALGQLLGAPALAHVTTNAIEARPGERIEIVLTLGHGCAGAPTTALRVAIPEGLTAVEPGAKDGWQTTASASEIGWTGGSVPDHQHEEFRIAATVSDSAVDQIVVPVIQICDDTQLRWIDADPGADNPAPLIKVLPAQ